jgi:hypothetical protein
MGLSTAPCSQLAIRQRDGEVNAAYVGLSSLRRWLRQSDQAQSRPSTKAAPTNQPTKSNRIGDNPGNLKFPRTTMAQFKELTDTAGTKIVVNLDAVRTIQQVTDTTTISFAGNHSIIVKDTPNDILMAKALNM